ncbi:aminotransferase class V-fold PLP-dependent enzyme [Vagococcus carniphilus]|uniref:Aminotransferase class V-fold PLP-dependent enzyme n=1 Tax=Vagococcus carniphilus TaxID=218144 RepID=A0AAW8U110_9ENTE|nr:aminotransferase class V-fold PLP-dependent enzyme [Vagococcus carniphilus]MDT2830420.1 aminotransferase class V-fold PLP-dependent enzyme [Vagococcus carniphilus]MDT2832456.1 aminotransferase class V-fold PLP-dependent enzyme [Vagococcus carniphilus]MDT2840011.1 aminotransferase class V-fold PLP-dependent enzyme [Vagococcus carniphilus]MDT2854502.1 aminotransferase class V-fold PLP-dependent enzyme [Vagococcus carniphilus]
MSIYFDNAATTAIKPKEVAQAVYETLLSGEFGNPARGSHDFSLNSFRDVSMVRQQIKELLKASDQYEVAFTNNATLSLNMMIKGLIGEGEHVVTTSWEHNAVLRPLYQLAEEKKVTFDVVPSDLKTGMLDVDFLEKAIKKETTTLLVTHGSNVTGNIMDLKRVKKIAQKHQLRLIIDGSQTMGQYPVSLEDGIVDAFCFTGHKSLYGPTGTGGICLKRELEKDLTPIISGGDGMQTFSKIQPRELPVLLEAGTLNVAGIKGLGAGIDYVNQRGVKAIHQYVNDLANVFISGIKDNPLIEIYGDFTAERAGVVSINLKNIDSATVSDVLWEDYGIAIRPGYHCAPLMHETLGTKDQGTLRFSFSTFNTLEEIEVAIKAINELSKEVTA